MIIREWKIADNEVIEGLERECFKTPWTKEMLDGSFTLNNFKGFIADENGVIVGYVGVIYDDWDGEILNVAVKKSERKNAVYWHACLMYAQGESMSNQSLRERFGLSDEKKNVVAMSRLIKECLEEALIKEEDEDAGSKYKRYIPYWA